MTKKNSLSKQLTPARRVRLSLVSGFLFVIMIGVMISSSRVVKNPTTETKQQISKESQVIAEKDYVSYQGKTGESALAILKQQGSIEQDISGLVIAINGRKALSDKREYWSFFVNGKMAEVGPSEYQTNDKDFIEWKIQRY